MLIPSSTTKVHLHCIFIIFNIIHLFMCFCESDKWVQIPVDPADDFGFLEANVTDDCKALDQLLRTELCSMVTAANNSKHSWTILIHEC